MSSPSPTQPPPVRSVPEQPVVRSTPEKSQTGQSSSSHVLKAIFRPIVKLFYYIFRWIGTHFPLAILVLILLIASIAATTYFTTGQFPFGLGGDQFNFHVRGTDGGGTAVKNWLYSLRDGDSTSLTLLDKNISSPPDPTQLISQFSQAKSNLTWKNITVLNASSQADGTVDSFVQVDLSANGPGGATSGILIMHFTTIDQSGQEYILAVNTVSFRAPLT